MDDAEFTKIATTAAVEVVKDRAEDIYNDVAKGALKESGESLQAIVGLFNHVVLYPIKKANITFQYKLEEFERDLKSKIDKIPESKIVEPDLTISGPTLEALKYTFDTKELREMYLNLLASAMNADLKDQTHPAFVEIIKAMSPLDARVFEKIAILGRIPFSNITIGFDDRTYAYAMPSMFIPEFLSLGEAFEISKSMVNVCRLGLAHIDTAHEMIGYDYDVHVNHYFVQRQKDKMQAFDSEKNLKIESKSGVVIINDLGISLQRCCFES